MPGPESFGRIVIESKPLATPDRTPLQKALMTRAAVLFFVGMLTGIWVGVVFTRGAALMLHLDFQPKHERLALGAHLNALLGCFWLLGLSWTLPHSRLSQAWQARLVTLTTFVAYANWGVTLLASVLDVRGARLRGPRAQRLGGRAADGRRGASRARRERALGLGAARRARALGSGVLAR